MESLIGLLGMLFFMFLVLAAAVEVILEVFRGLLEQFGFTWSKSNISLEDALKLSSEFSMGNVDLNTRIEAVKSAADQIDKKAQDITTSLKAINERLKLSSSTKEELAAELNSVAYSVKSQLDKIERQRIFILRCIAAIIGCFLAWQCKFYVFQMLAQSKDLANWLAALQGLQPEWINILVGGLAAAAGSSYWHDQLDKVRNIKSVTQELKKLA